MGRISCAGSRQTLMSRWGGKNRALLELWRDTWGSSQDGDVGKQLELHQGCQRHFQGSRGKVEYLLRCCSRKGPHFAWRGESPGFSWVTAGNLGFLWSYDGDIRFLIMFPQESQVSMRVVRGLSGFLSSRCRGLWPLMLRPDPKIPLQCWHGSRASYGVSKRSQASSFVKAWKSAFLSSCKCSVRFQPSWHRDLGFSRGATGL